MTSMEERDFNRHQVRRARESQGWSQLQLAESLETSNISVQNWESGRKPPSRKSLTKLASATGKPVDFFFEPEPEVSGQETETLPRTATKEPRSVEQRLLSLLEKQQDIVEKQQDIVEKQRLDIANLTEAIRLQQADFLQERDFSRRFAAEQMERVQTELASLRQEFFGLRSGQTEQEALAGAMVRLEAAEKLLAMTRKLPPARAGEASRAATAGGASNG